MDSTRLFLGFVMLISVVLAHVVLLAVHDWRGRVQALHLRWEREQRQAVPVGVTLPQRQDVQAAFEQLVSARPLTKLWYVGALVVVLAACALGLAWEHDALRWVALWLVLPLGILALLNLVLGWLVVRGGSAQLAKISASLYGPPPPRVKVRDIRVTQDDSAVEY